MIYLILKNIPNKMINKITPIKLISFTTLFASFFLLKAIMAVGKKQCINKVIGNSM